MISPVIATSSRTGRPLMSETSAVAIVIPALAAQRNDIATVIAPALNESDIEDIPEHLRRRIDFVFVEQIAEVLETALEPVPGRARRRAATTA